MMTDYDEAGSYFQRLEASERYGPPLARQRPRLDGRGNKCLLQL